MLRDFFLIFLPLFVVVNPAGSLPVVLALTPTLTAAQRWRIALRATIAAGVTGILFVILGQAIFSFVGVDFADFQIAGGILLVILAVMNLLIPEKAAKLDSSPALERAESIGIVPLGIPLIVGPATLTTSLLLVNTFGAKYDEAWGAPLGQIIVSVMVCIALVLNLGLLLLAIWNAERLVKLVGESAMKVLSKIVMILLAAIAVSLIRQGIVSIVREVRAG